MAPFNFIQRGGSVSRSDKSGASRTPPGGTPLAHGMDSRKEAKESDKPVPPVEYRSASRPPVRSSYEPSKAFVRMLVQKPEYRSHLASLLKEHVVSEGGSQHVESWLKDEGFETSIPAVLKAFDTARTSDLSFWSSRYNLFVLWSADGKHPWDELPGAGSHATLEIGRKRSTEREVIVLLNGRPVPSWTFEAGVLKTSSPVEWQTPTGKTALVLLELQLSAFFGYGQAATEGYMGLQCHGVLWPATATDAHTQWPIAPPIVAGKVNIADRKAAVNPGSADSLAAFAGTYACHRMPAADSNQGAEAAFELGINVTPQGRPTVTLDGRALSKWSFNAANVLSWGEEGAACAWLQFMVLPGGPVFMGSLSQDGQHGPWDLFGELHSQPSRLAPDFQMDAAVGRIVAGGLATAASLLTASMLRSAERCWDALRQGVPASDLEKAPDALLARMEAEFETLRGLDSMGAAAAAAFPGAPAGLDMSHEAAQAALTAETEAAEHAQMARTAAEATEGAALEAEEAAAENNPLDATSKAAVAAWRASQAQCAAMAAEASALDAGTHARAAATLAALTAAQAAAQSFNLAKELACGAARGEERAAAAALRAVEAGIALYAERRDYLRLKDIAEASDVAGKTLESAKQAAQGWAAGSMTVRGGALEAAKRAAESSQVCHKLVRAVNKAA